MNWLICRGRFRGGQRRGSGSELSIWDYPDLMGGIKRPMGGNPSSIRADFVILTCDVILQEPFRGSAGELAQQASRWQYIQFHGTSYQFYKGQDDVGPGFIFNTFVAPMVWGLNLYKFILSSFHRASMNIIFIIIQPLTVTVQLPSTKLSLFENLCREPKIAIKWPWLRTNGGFKKIDDGGILKWNCNWKWIWKWIVKLIKLELNVHSWEVRGIPGAEGLLCHMAAEVVMVRRPLVQEKMVLIEKWCKFRYQVLGSACNQTWLRVHVSCYHESQQMGALCLVLTSGLKGWLHNKDSAWWMDSSLIDAW